MRWTTSTEPALHVRRQPRSQHTGNLLDDRETLDAGQLRPERRNLSDITSPFPGSGIDISRPVEQIALVQLDEKLLGLDETPFVEQSQEEVSRVVDSLAGPVCTIADRSEQVPGA